MSFAKDNTKPIGELSHIGAVLLSPFSLILTTNLFFVCFVRFVGGNIMAHASTTRLKLKKGRGDNRICQVRMVHSITSACAVPTSLAVALPSLSLRCTTRPACRSPSAHSPWGPPALRTPRTPELDTVPGARCQALYICNSRVVGRVISSFCHFALGCVERPCFRQPL